MSFMTGLAGCFPNHPDYRANEIIRTMLADAGIWDVEEITNAGDDKTLRIMRHLMPSDGDVIVTIPFSWYENAKTVGGDMRIETVREMIRLYREAGFIRQCNEERTRCLAFPRNSA